MSTELLLLDLDNTVFDYPPCHQKGQKEAWKKAKDLGYEMSFEEFKELYREGSRETKRDIQGTASSHNRYLYFKKALRRFSKDYDPTHALEIGDSYWKGYLDKMDLFPGVEKTLQKIKDEGIDIAVITDQLVRTQMEKIEELGIKGFIDLMVTSEEVGADKPSSVMFSYPLTMMEANRKDAVLIGDNISKDIAGGNSLGIETVLFNNEWKEEEHPDWQRPDHQIEEFRQLLEIVK